MRKRIAIIGAGLSGLTLARELGDIADVTIFEKARGVGGRMSTRYAEPFYFDHGAQFFTARTEAFQKFIAPLIADGVIAEWVGKIAVLSADNKHSDSLWFESHYVATPQMNSLCKYLAYSLKIILNTEVAPLNEKRTDGWHLQDKNSGQLGVFDWIISTAPPEQTVRLFGRHLPASSPLHHTQLLGCYTLMLGFKRSWKESWIAAKILKNPIEWVAINSSKPGRDTSITSIVVHSSSAWAQAHIDDDINTVSGFLRQQLEGVTGIETASADYFACHRWRYAQVTQQKKIAPFFDSALGIASSGDWCSESRIEDVWLNCQLLKAQLIALN